MSEVLSIELPDGQGARPVADTSGPYTQSATEAYAGLWGSEVIYLQKVVDAMARLGFRFIANSFRLVDGHD